MSPVQTSLRRTTTSALFALLAVLSLTNRTTAAEGNVRHVTSHDRVLAVTDPSDGTNSYPKWALFPDSSVEYRKVTLWITYECPDSLHCGEWDYIDQIMLRRIGGESAKPRNIELARMISPYGWRFGQDWSFQWHVDITDFALLLHDSVEIEFVHTGYESNADRGWKVTLDFEISEGRPSMRPLAFDTLWCGSFLYGDTALPIENLLKPIQFYGPVGSEFARVRIHQTGHGMDDSANCAEFCRKYRQLFFNDSLFAQRFLWRECGDNPLYPQSGTWIFDRANWCPGAVVYPDQYDLPFDNSKAQQIDLQMEPYINPNKPSANWQIYSYLIYYEAPWATNDVSIEEIVAPSRLAEYSRMNPVCGQPRIVIRNNGRDTLRSVNIVYGVDNAQQTFGWIGSLATNASTEIALHGSIPMGDANGSGQFVVALDSPNGMDDEYPADNRMRSQTVWTPMYPEKFILAIKTNRDSMQNSYKITDVDGNVVRERSARQLAANTLYLDTITCNFGCYRLQVEDTAGDGLDFWFNIDGGYGYARMLDLDGRLLRSFDSDFGSNIDEWFLTGTGSVTYPPDSVLPIVQPFPPRNQGKCEVDLFFDRPTDAILRIVTEDSSRTVFNQPLLSFKEGLVPVDISAEPDGIYWLKVDADGKTVTRRIRLKR